jgi:hypothetical protein
MESNVEGTEGTEKKEVEVGLAGAFYDSLIRANSKIKKDRAISIAEDVYLIYKRTVEDLTQNLRKLKRARENALDLSPETALGLKPAVDFDTSEWVRTDIDLGVKIRNEEIKLEIAQRQFKQLFAGGI